MTTGWTIYNSINLDYRELDRGGVQAITLSIITLILLLWIL